MGLWSFVSVCWEDDMEKNIRHKENLVYKILTVAEWREIEIAEKILLSDLDRASGFVHLSTPEQLLETCRRYFQAEEELLAIEIETQKLGEELRWETVAARDHQKFPHLYRELHFSDIQALQYIRLENANWIFGKRVVWE